MQGLSARPRESGNPESVWLPRASIGGVAGPWLFGALIDTGSRWSLFVGYLFGAVLMLAAAFIAARYGVAAERRSLESISRPLAAAE